MNRHHSYFGSRASVLAVISPVLLALGVWAGCSDDSGSGLGDAGLDGGPDTGGDAEVIRDAQPDGRLQDAGLVACTIGYPVEYDCI